MPLHDFEFQGHLPGVGFVPGFVFGFGFLPDPIQLGNKVVDCTIDFGLGASWWRYYTGPLRIQPTFRMKMNVPRRGGFLVSIERKLEGVWHGYLPLGSYIGDFEHYAFCGMGGGRE